MVLEGLVGAIDNPFGLNYLSFGNVRVQWVAQADMNGLLWKEARVFGTAYFFSPCDCPSDAPMLVRSSNDTVGDICKATEMGWRNQCPGCCYFSKDKNTCLSKETHKPCRADRRTNAWSTTFGGRIREDGAVSVRIDMYE